MIADVVMEHKMTVVDHQEDQETALILTTHSDKVGAAQVCSKLVAEADSVETVAATVVALVETEEIEVGSAVETVVETEEVSVEEEVVVVVASAEEVVVDLVDATAVTVVDTVEEMAVTAAEIVADLVVAPREVVVVVTHLTTWDSEGGEKGNDDYG